MTTDPPKTIHDYQQLYREALFDTDLNRAMQVVRYAVDDGVLPEDVVLKIASPALLETMDGLSDNVDDNLARHYLTAQISLAIAEEMIPRFSQKMGHPGRVVIGTVEGDLHSLGKMIVGGCLKSLMIEVFDLGVNVSKAQFVEAAIENEAHVIGMSSMMVHTARGTEGCIGVRKLLEEKGLAKKTRLVVGGAPFRFDHNLYKKIGADAWASDGVRAAEVITKLVSEVQR